MTDGPIRFREAPDSGYLDEGWAYAFVCTEFRNFGEVLRWCSDQFPRFNGETWRWHQIGLYLLFTQDDDALAFKMRWC